MGVIGVPIFRTGNGNAVHLRRGNATDRISSSARGLSNFIDIDLLIDQSRWILQPFNVDLNWLRQGFRWNRPNEWREQNQRRANQERSGA
jgi:hypothetical protein